MSNIFTWPYSWMNMGGKPKMDSMLQAIIDEDVEKLRYLRNTGMSLVNSDENTLQRLLFEKISASEIMKVLIEEEYITSFQSADSKYREAKWILGQCIGQDGYTWDLMAKACYEKEYKTMELLARYRFNGTSYVINGKSYEIQDLIFQRDDLTALKILYENGDVDRVIDGMGDFCVYRIQRENYPNRHVTKYINEHPYPTRKSMGLDYMAFRTIDSPNYQKVGIFNRKKKMQANELERLNYEDRIRAQRDYSEWLIKTHRWERWKRYIAADNAASKDFFENVLPLFLEK